MQGKIPRGFIGVKKPQTKDASIHWYEAAVCWYKVEFGRNYSFQASLVFVLSSPHPLLTTALQEMEEGGRRLKSRWEEKRLRGEIAAFFFSARMFKTSPAFTLGGIQPCGEHQFSFAPGFDSSVSEVFVSRLRCGEKSLSFEMAIWGKKSVPHVNWLATFPASVTVTLFYQQVSCTATQSHPQQCAA